MDNFPLRPIARRRALSLLGAAGAAVLLKKTPAVDAATCVLATPQVTEGPYWVDEKLFRSDIRTDPTTGVARAGIPLTFTIAIQNASGSSCIPLAGALVDVWHCDAKGIYSDEAAYNPGGGTGTVVTTGQKFLRGYQITDDNGEVQFTTIYPGWYSGRTIHIHVRVRTYSGTTVLDNYVTQLFFDDTISNTVLANSAYSRTTSRDTLNSNDMVYEGASNPSRMLMPVTQNGSSYTGPSLWA
jgi:protocatechuate 3,4-dioxygenase beta subunit